MKKTCAFVVICLLLSNVACQSTQAYPWPLVESDRAIDSGDVTLSIVGAYAAQGDVLLCIENNGTEEILYGRDYILQLMDQGIWYDIDVSTDWPADAVTVMPGQRSSKWINWSQIYGKLPKGCYRIVQKYRKASETYFSAYPFVIE